ncbi:MAG TPA: 8-oxo-dGTP diphosphatase MutT [Steroidobacteraceae bacterium]|jgi:8-oxo-dGTP diphosphatase|nr:8-oxo-dGTP diphosphatase MutT [Steroidobacteraceae bacterium]
MTLAVRVVAGVLRDSHGRVLIAQRPEGKHMAGFWEFPGGKIAPGESGEQALARELTEELGVSLRRCHPLLQLRHDYADRVVELDVFVVDDYRGEPTSREAQALKWVRASELAGEPLLPADRPIIDALNFDEVSVYGTGHRIA